MKRVLLALVRFYRRAISPFRPPCCRRRLREVYRLEKPQLKTGYDIILVARSRTATAPWPELQKQFRRLCRKVDLMKEPV